VKVTNTYNWVITVNWYLKIQMIHQSIQVQHSVHFCSLNLKNRLGLTLNLRVPTTVGTRINP